MAHNTKPILVDVNGRPIPQYFDPLADEYKPLLGAHGAARAILYGPDGQPIGTSGNPLQVKAQDTDDALEQIKTALEALATEDKLEAVRLLLQTLDGKDFATQTTLAQVKQVLDTLTSAVSTSSKQDALNIAVEDLKSELILVKSELATIKANQLSGDQKVQLSGQNATSVNAFNALAITDTALKLSGDLPIFRTHPHKAIIVLNSLDNSVTIRLYSNSVGGDHLTVSGIVVGPHLPRVITAADAEFAMLDVLFSSNINIQIAAVCSTAPTSGSLTVTVVGWF